MKPPAYHPPYGSPLEDKFASYIYKHLVSSIDFQKQVEVKTTCGTFRLDFVADDGNTRLAFECDGKEYHQGRQVIHDDFRDAMILGEGAIDYIFRLRGKDILYAFDAVLHVIACSHPEFFRGGCNRFRSLVSEEFEEVISQTLEPDWSFLATGAYSPLRTIERIRIFRNYIDPCRPTESLHQYEWIKHRAFTSMDEILDAFFRGEFSLVRNNAHVATDSVSDDDAVVSQVTMQQSPVSNADEIAHLTYGETHSIQNILSQTRPVLWEYVDDYSVDDAVSVETAIGDYYERLEYRYTHQSGSKGILTGFKELDSILGGMRGGNLLVIAAQSGMGKTSWLLSVALNAARYDQCVAVYSLEMGIEQVALRLVTQETKISPGRLRAGQVTPEEWARFNHAVDRLSKLRIIIDDTPNLSIEALQHKVRQLHEQEVVDLIIVDYLQLMDAGEGWRGSREQEIGKVSRSLKTLAKQCDVPVLVAVQISSSVARRQGEHPRLSDWRECEQVEQIADVVMFTCWDAVHNPDPDNPSIVEVDVLKHRSGRTGRINLYFEKKLGYFGDLYHPPSSVTTQDE